LVLGPVLFGANQFEALAATEIVVAIAIKTGPKLRVVVALRRRKVTPERNVRRIFAKVRIGFAERVTISRKFGVGIGVLVARGAKAVKAELAGTAAGQPEMR